MKERAEKRNYKTFFILFAVLVLFSIIYFICAAHWKTNCNAEESKTKNFCTPESRNSQVCIEVYQPVCGWFNAEKVKCIRYPCAQTYSNSCFACMDNNVDYWTDGECPK